MSRVHSKRGQLPFSTERGRARMEGHRRVDSDDENRPWMTRSKIEHVDEGYYASLERMFEQASRAADRLPTWKRKLFHGRLESLRSKAGKLT